MIRYAVERLDENNVCLSIQTLVHNTGKWTKSSDFQSKWKRNIASGEVTVKYEKAGKAVMSFKQENEKEVFRDSGPTFGVNFTAGAANLCFRNI
jgi:predicted metal-binding protein